MEEDRTRDVIVVADSVPPQCPSKSPELLDVDTLLRDDSPAVDEQLEEDDIDGETTEDNWAGRRVHASGR